MDNGSELTSPHFLAWGVEPRITLNYIQPGKSMQNAHAENCNSKFRDECRNTNWFSNLWEARRRIRLWREEYNSRRPHSSLDYLTPEQFAAKVAANGFGSDEQGKVAQTPPPSPAPLPPLGADDNSPEGVLQT